MEIKPIAHIRTEFPEKFGIPRQSGLAAALRGKIVFEPQFRSVDALRGLDGFSHIWLVWEFSANGNAAEAWQPLVRPPRLGGNDRIGVFASRSPFRPNPLGLSCVRLESISYSETEGPVIIVRGADLMDGTPIYDIKPYIKYSDCKDDAICGYVESLPETQLDVSIPEKCAAVMSDPSLVRALTDVLRLDPRPSYHNDPYRKYGMCFSGFNVTFTVNDGLLAVSEIRKL